MKFISEHLVWTLIAVVAMSAFAGLVVGALLAAAGRRMPRQSEIEPGVLSDGTRCAWCDMEAARKAQPHESHGICQRHKEEKMAEARRFGRSQFAA